MSLEETEAQTLVQQHLLGQMKVYDLLTRAKALRDQATIRETIALTLTNPVGLRQMAAVSRAGIVNEIREVEGLIERALAQSLQPVESTS